MKKPAELGAIDIAAVQSRMLTRNKLEVKSLDLQSLSEKTSAIKEGVNVMKMKCESHVRMQQRHLRAIVGGTAQALPSGHGGMCDLQGQCGKMRGEGW